mmetsp:Transcript_16135/g.44961  ORF Transcript_16135/g.44961 Transcript_16135/m.44961 type:complete len:336 (+) Transcript_16135:162-1169(+)|eukprot:CAMPEP_0117666708 /NCGR_PEP_ID=MMETSP0804-20121206/10533_1 /TAXON_ID=1074897 /ORGANISM="Tetraselmis astigmatica, Strain CCMP880" /LENGTH=335 /DNA_ID=CAMNT_0005474297 /DNA_START=99 /DNA_END=1106 /DNA_ORIENTATION=+
MASPSSSGALDLGAVAGLLSRAAPEAIAMAALCSLGAFVVARVVLAFIGGVWRYFLRPGKNLRKSYGEWAVVTGATDGIGKAFCEQLAKQKINVVLVSRTESKLQELSSSLENTYKVQTRYVVVDFSKTTAETWSKVSQCISNLDVGILINNVGMSYPHAEFLDVLEEQVIADITQINVHCTTQMIRTVLPVMLKKEKGAVVNVGSGAATVLPSDPLYSVYAGTKGYVDQLTRSLAVEYAGKGIDFQLQAPLYVATKMAKIRRASLTAPSSATYAKAGLKQLGYEMVCTPYWVHAFMWTVLSCLPDSFINSQRLAMCLSIRERAYKKKNAAAKED